MSTDTSTESVVALATTLTSVYGIDRIKPCEQAATLLRTLAAERDALRAALEAERERCAQLIEPKNERSDWALLAQYSHYLAQLIRSTPKDPT